MGSKNATSVLNVLCAPLYVLPIISLSDRHIMDCLSGFFQVCGDSMFPVNRLVLAACSDQFAAMFGADATVVNFSITDLDSETLAQMLEFIYSGNVATERMSLKLLRAAVDYGIESLVRVCERHLIRHLCDQNVVDTLIAVHGTLAKYLLKAASIYYLQNYDQLEESREVARLEKSYPEISNVIVKVSVDRSVLLAHRKK